MKTLEVNRPPGRGGINWRRFLPVSVTAGLAALALTACAVLGGASQVLGAIQAVASVAGRPASPAANQTAAVVSERDPTIGDKVIMRGTQGLIVANNAYQSAAAIAEAYVRSGLATPAQLQRIRQLNDRAIVLLERGGQGLSLAQRAAEVLNIVAELNLFSGRR